MSSPFLALFFLVSFYIQVQLEKFYTHSVKNIISTLNTKGSERLAFLNLINNTGNWSSFPLLGGVHQGGVIFEREKIGHLPSCAKLLQDPNSKISPLKVGYFWGTRPQKILPLTLKLAPKILYLTFLKVASEAKCVPQVV